MRLILALCLLAAPASAWEFTSIPVCTLSHAQDDIEVTVTYDPRLTDAYTLRMTRGTDWPIAPVFGIRFDPGGPFISTNRHRTQGNTLSASDSGFENVLTGLEQNFLALAIVGDETLTIRLDGAAPEVAKFRACLVTPSV